MDVFLTGVFGVDAALTHARAAELNGLGGVWLAEHPGVRYGQFGSAIDFAARFLDATSHITIGTAACVYPHHDPVELASRARSLGERFHLGVARGPGDPVGFARWLEALDFPARVAVTSLDSATLAARLGMPMQLGVEKTDAEVLSFVASWEATSGIRGEHSRLLVPVPMDRVWMAEWLSRKVSGRDWTAHLDRLEAIHPVTEVGVRRPMCMVEAAGSIGATAKLIESLADGGG